MASETVIDALIVRLGLDPTSYKKGVADATKAQKTFKDNTKKSSGEIGDALKSVTRQVAAMVIGFESLKGAISFLAGINTADAALGRLAANTGVSVHELNKWGNAVELVGGDSKEAQGDISNLASSLVNLRAKGDVSPMIELMYRLGVAMFDAQGKTRNLFDILNDAGGQLRKMDHADAFQLARNAGLSEGTLNLLLEQEAARKRIFAEAERANNLDDAAAKRAAELQKEWREMVQSARAFGRELLEAIAPAAREFLEAIRPAGESLRGILKGLNDAHVGEALGKAVELLAAAIDRLVKMLPDVQAFTSKVFEAIDKAANTPGFTAKIEGVRDVFSTPEEVANRAAVKKVGDTQGMVAAAKTLQQQMDMAAAKAGHDIEYPYGTGHAQTTVQIDSITVHTQATDAEGVARDLNGAINRKLSIAQADTGMN